MSEPKKVHAAAPAVPPLAPDAGQGAAPGDAGRYGAVWLDARADAPPRQDIWLWEGYLARGHVTVLTSQWKMGKTTLLSVLLSRMGAGGTVAGLPVAAGRAVVVSEEGLSRWEARTERLGLGAQACVISRPFAGKPTRAQWLDLLAHLGELHRQYGLALVVIDTLGELLPAGAESGASEMLEALLPLRQLTARGVAVLLLHHPRKGAAPDGQGARGTGALAANADILIEMHWYTRGAEADRRRRLLAWSRLEGTPRQRVIELNADGTDYAALGDFAEDEFAPAWARLRGVLEGASDKLTRAEILRAWPEGAAVSRATLGRWLERAAALGLVRREGLGRSGDPFRYWLAEQEAKWAADPARELERQHAEAVRMWEELGAEMGGHGERPAW